jgi:hypothetical protein
MRRKAGCAVLEINPKKDAVPRWVCIFDMVLE